MNRIFQTSELSFPGLKDYHFQSNYVMIDGYRIHYIDEGPSSEKPVLLLHGVPTWSYIYRHVIPNLVGKGIRVIAPDLVGFGKSDKPEQTYSHTYQSHVKWIIEFITKLNLRDIILFCHDWGSLIGLRIAAQNPNLFSGIIVSNGMLPVGEHKIHFSFKLWRFFAKYSPYLPVDLIVQYGVLRKLDKDERKAYRAPFPSNKLKAGIRALPDLVPLSPYDPESLINKLAWESLSNWKKPFLTVFSKNDSITRNAEKYMQNLIPGAKGINHYILKARHFILEDRSQELSDIIIKFRGMTVKN